MNVTVVGGGITGITSALLYARQGHQVSLVEAAPELGGLYRTALEAEGFAFDFGSHLPLSTGIEELDTLLFGGLSPDAWWSFDDSLREYGYHLGRLNEYSNCLDARQLPPEEYERAVLEFLALPPGRDPRAATLEELLPQTHGTVITEKLYRPVLHKLTGLDLGQLSPLAHKIHGLSRIILFEKEMTSLLKTLPHFDLHIADTDAKLRVSPTWKYYPKSGGCGEFITHLEKLLQDADIKTMVGTQVTGAELNGNTVKALQSSRGSLDTDHLVWTVPPIFLMKGLGWDISGFSPPRFRAAALFHFAFDKEITTDGHYVYCYDNDKTSYRTSLYENMTLEERVPPPHHLTVEVFTDDREADLDALAPVIWQEQKDMGLVHPEAELLLQSHQALPNGWPALTNEFFRAQEQQREMVSERIDNISLFGRASGAHHMIPQLHHIWNALA